MSVVDTIRRWLRRPRAPERATTPQPQPPVVKIDLDFPWDGTTEAREALFDRWVAENGLTDSVTVPPAPATQRYTHKRLELMVDGVPIRSDVMAKNPAYDPVAEARAAFEAEEARRRTVARPYSPDMEIVTVWTAVSGPLAEARRGPAAEVPVRDESGRQIGVASAGIYSPTLRMAVGLRVYRVVDPPLPQYVVLALDQSHSQEFGHVQIPLQRAKDLRDELARAIVAADEQMGLVHMVIS